MTTDLARYVQPGDRIVAGQGMAEPTALLRELFAALASVPDLGYFAGMSMSDVLSGAPPSMELASFLGMGANTSLIATGRMRLVPCQMSELPALLTTGPYAPDVLAVLVSPPNSDGLCSLGLESDYLWPALHRCRVVLAEINERVPFIAGDTLIPMERFAATITTDRALPHYTAEIATEVERAIAAHVAGLIRDGSCIQVGIGRFADAVLEQLSGHRDLGVHSGMVGDQILELTRCGVITNRAKTVDAGLTVAGAVLGSERCVAMAQGDPMLRLRSLDHTHHPGVLAALDDLVSVNSAIEVDLFGQINAETAAGRYVGGVGGSADFMRGARMSHGGMSITALPSTGASGSKSRIVGNVETVTTSRSDIDTLVTEYGIARLTGVPLDQRAGRIIEVAAPAHREALRAEAKALGL